MKHPRNVPYVCDFCYSQLTMMWLIENNHPDKVEAAVEDRQCQKCGRHLISLEKIRILGPYIMVEPMELDVIRKSGVIIPAMNWKFWLIGKVVKLGEKESYKCKKLNQRREPVGGYRFFTRPEVNVGDIVLFEKLSPKRFDICGMRMVFVHYDDVPLLVEDVTSIIPT